MFYIRSSATLRKCQIARLEPKCSDIEVSSSNSSLENDYSKEIQTDAVLPSSTEEKTSDSIEQPCVQRDPMFISLLNKPPPNHKLKFLKKNEKIISSIENIIIPSGVPSTKDDTSFQAELPKLIRNEKLCPVVKKIEPIRKKCSSVDKKNIASKKNKIDEGKPRVSEAISNACKIPYTEDNRKLISAFPKNSTSSVKNSATKSSNATNPNQPCKRNPKEKTHTKSNFDRYSVPVEASISRKPLHKKPIDTANKGFHIQKSSKYSDSKTPREKVPPLLSNYIQKSSDSKPSREKVAPFHLKSKGQKEVPAIRKTNNTSNEINLDLSRIPPGTPDIYRDGSGDSEKCVNSPLKYQDAKKRSLKPSQMSKFELEKLSRFRRINSKIMEAVENPSGYKSYPASANETDDYDDASEIESLEKIRQKAKKEEDEEALNECALQACLFLETNCPKYFQHLIKRYQLDVKTSDHVELRTRKQDIIRIASQNNSKLVEMEKMYTRYIS